MPRQNTSPADYPQAVLQQIEQLAQNIAIARKRRKETQAQWAQRLGVSQPTMARIERGDPSVAMASYVMCMWLINQAQGLAELIAPQKDLASLEREVARTRPRAPRSPLVKAPKKSTVPQAASPLGMPSVIRAAEPVFDRYDTATSASPEKAVQPSLSERPANSTAAGLASLIAGHKKARP